MKYKPALLRFKFHNFANIPHADRSSVFTEVQTDCNGHQWSVELDFENETREGEGEGGQCWIGLYLENKNTEEIYPMFGFSIKTTKGVTIKEENGDLAEGWGFSHFIERSTILDPINNILKDGALCIELTIQVKDESDELYDPSKAIHEKHIDKMLELLKNEEKADVSVDISGKIFHLHSLILDNNAPLLAAYCKPNDGSRGVIKGVNPYVFQTVLEYVYAGYCELDDDYSAFESLVDYGRELIDAANRFELVEFKLAIERALVRERILNKKNVSEYIAFADAQCCPLLKEYAISYFLLHAKEILNSDYSKCLRESGELLSEIIKLLTDKDEDDMDVNELRMELSKRKLDVDGSKEVLVSRLEESKRRRTE